MLLSQYPLEWMHMRCDICGRWGRYWRERLITHSGRVKRVPDVLRDVADCSRWGAGGEPCGAHLPDLTTAGDG